MSPEALDRAHGGGGVEVEGPTGVRERSPPVAQRDVALEVIAENRSDAGIDRRGVACPGLGSSAVARAGVRKASLVFGIGVDPARVSDLGLTAAREAVQGRKKRAARGTDADTHTDEQEAATTTHCSETSRRWGRADDAATRGREDDAEPAPSPS